MKKKYVILLTACVNPDGMPFTVLNDASERLRQYRKALEFYLTESSYPIVFCENTLCDFSDDYKNYINKGRLEFITFDGNKFDKTKGKGYGEAIIMEEAFRRSKLIAENNFIVKITGRLLVRNISQLITDNKRTLTQTIQTFSPKNNMIDSRFTVCPKSFYINDFLSRKEQINDTKGKYFEHVLHDTLLSRRSFVYIPFLRVPLIEGVSGSSGKEYNPSAGSYDNLRFAFDMLGNAIRIDKSNHYYHMSLLYKLFIIMIRCILKLF